MTREELIQLIYDLYAKVRAALGQSQISPSERLKERIAEMPMHKLLGLKQMYESLLEPDLKNIDFLNNF